MTIDRPLPAQLPQLHRLWKEAFGDTDEAIDAFFQIGFSYDRSRCITRQETVVAALYWFDCQFENKKLAYLYAVATAKEARGQGLCRTLMEDTHRHLQQLGYDGCILVPQGAELFALYEKLGYRICSHVREFSCTAAAEPAMIRSVGTEEYARLRRRYLPPGGVIQEGALLCYQGSYAGFYAGEDFLLCAYPDGDQLVVCELLGRAGKASQILRALEYAHGFFRVPGSQTPFAMYRSLTADPTAPNYFGLAML